MLSMGGVFLVITGGEALYADMGHLGRRSIMHGWFLVALPGLILNYFGQGALLLREPSFVTNPFYFLAEPWMQVPLVILATAATIIASQAVISGFFSWAHQCVQLGYLPRLNIIHTSEKEVGQIYVSTINWLALIGTLWLVIEFKSSSNLAAAYGVSISVTMVITTILTSIVAWHTWRWKFVKILLVFAGFFAIEVVFATANLLKFFDGGWIAVMIGVCCFALVTTWKKGRLVLYERLRSKSYPFAQLLEDIKTKKLARVSGAAVFMVGDADLTPPTLLHNIHHNKVLHETIVFLTIIGEEVAYISEANRLQARKIADGVYRLTAHYGFSQQADVLGILKKAENILPGFKADNPTFFLGREILVAGAGKEMSFWRKILFSVMARNAESANSYFKLPLDQVIEVGMQIEL
jgi:KUP system potassium uptake protein